MVEIISPNDLKIIYETFYKAYNPAGADRLGIVYTPNEIVRFMVEAADHLTERHFGKLLQDEGVVILDPATGTGTFITEIIEYLPKAQLGRKYKHELFCNEVALLPYYTANLNIEYTFQQKMGHYAEFENIALVDTLDNLNYVGASGQFGMFELTAENLERIRRQNEQKISVIIGNPPYNANQLNENDNNKNRPYPAIDARIKGTYVKESTAQKTKVYDMYARFLRWATDRVGENGVVAFVSNNSFINAATFDGFRKCVARDFNEIYVIDMKGNARTSGERRKQEGGNVFSDTIRVGVAVYFLVRKEGVTGSRIFYNAVDDYWTDDRKKAYLRDNKLPDIDFKHIVPDKNNNWIHQSESNWDEFLPVATPETKATDSPREENAIFKLYSLGVSTNRDEWVYDLDEKTLKEKVKFFVSFYSSERARWLKQGKTVWSGKLDDRKELVGDFVDRTIKWTNKLEAHFSKGSPLEFDADRTRMLMYRPFLKQFYYADSALSDRLTVNHFEMFGRSLTESNKTIAVNVSNRPFNVVAADCLVDIHFNGDSQCLPLYRYDKSGNRLENITNWGLTQFRTHYADEGISRSDIFNYVYGVLHDPAYRKKYELNLRREFPRIPFYDDFAQWAAWGERLLKLHLDFETVEPYPLVRTNLPNIKNPKAKLRADKAVGEILLDTETTLSGVPAAAWDYKLGNRSALEWVLERYKERTPKDKTVAERFNTYRFADYKEEVVTLLGRVCRVSVETSEVVAEMNRENGKSPQQVT